MSTISLNTASTGLNALSTSLDVIANNLANVNTTGFRSSRANFEDLFYLERGQPGIEQEYGNSNPTGLQVGTGCECQRHQSQRGPGRPRTDLGLISTSPSLEMAGSRSKSHPEPRKTATATPERGTSLATRTARS